MVNAADKPPTTNDPIEDKIEQVSKMLAARQLFLGSTLNMGWRLAVTVVIPIVAGVKIDEHFRTSPSYTLLGLMLAAVAGSAAVWSAIQQVNREQADEEKRHPKTKRKEKA